MGEKTFKFEFHIYKNSPNFSFVKVKNKFCLLFVCCFCCMTTLFDGQYHRTLENIETLLKIPFGSKVYKHLSCFCGVLVIKHRKVLSFLFVYVLIQLTHFNPVRPQCSMCHVPVSEPVLWTQCRTFNSVFYDEILFEDHATERNEMLKVGRNKKSRTKIRQIFLTFLCLFLISIKFSIKVNDSRIVEYEITGARKTIRTEHVGGTRMAKSGGNITV